MVRPDIALQLTDDFVFPAHVIRSFLFFVIVASPGMGVNLNVRGGTVAAPYNII